MKTVYILNGPNLNLLGSREPQIYGYATLSSIEKRCERLAQQLDVNMVFRQSNHEGDLVDWIQEARLAADGVILNPAGLSFYSISVKDAVKALGKPCIELHMSNVHARDLDDSVVSKVATAVICGLGAYGYEVALSAMAGLLSSSGNFQNDQKEASA
ncbi:3-dehydroquinate dehydratase-2 [Paraburkholderia sp. GAS199]|uniref:type II 3-dehydroquinate dehydratase n=1 Tax=Paraburkholderia sp. GAS199 TaxID=3035126 RepID=UPI003D22566F